jgi:hypothetical protein
VATAGSSGVPGDPGVLRGAAMSFGGASGHLGGLAGDLSGARAGSWSGPASVACHGLCVVLSHTLTTGADGFGRAAITLRRLADAIEEAQERAEAALQGAADADSEASSLAQGDDPPTGRIDELHTQATLLRGVADAARADAETAALAAAAIFSDIAGMAPKPPPPPQPAPSHDDGGGGWFDGAVSFVKGIPGAAKDGYNAANGWIDDREADMEGLLDHLPGPLADGAHFWWNTSIMSPKFNIDFAQGVGDWGVGMVETVPMLVRLSPQYGMIDPAGQRRQQQELVDGLSYAWNHKGDTAKALVGWNHVENGEPGRMAGQLAPDVVLAILSGGGSAAAKTARGARVMEEMGEAATAARRFEELPALTREEQLAARQWRDSLPTRETPTGRPSGRYEVEMTGPHNYEMSVGDVRINADGFREFDATALEAKHVGSQTRSPFVPGSDAPDFVRAAARTEIEKELQRYKLIIDSSDTPVRGLEIITNDARAVPYFEELLDKHDMVGRVVVRGATP